MNRMRIHGAQFGLGLLLALTLWTYVSFTTNPNAPKQIVVQVTPVGPKQGLIVVNAETGRSQSFSASATLSIVGPQQEIQALTPKDFPTTAHLENAKPGVNRVPITVEKKPRFVQIQDKVPDVLVVGLARELEKTVPITVTSTGQPPFSFSAGRLTQGALESSVRGPEDLVQKVAGAVAQLNLQRQTSDISMTLTLRPVDRQGNQMDGVILTPARVSVQMPITAQVQVQQVSVVPDLRSQPAPGYAVGSIDWDPKTVQVFASGAITGTIHTQEIDLSGLTGPISRTVGLERPANVITRPPGVRVTVHVGIIPIAVPSQLPLLVPVSPAGLGAGLAATAKPTAVQITLAGAFDRLNHLKSGDVTATVDLAGLGPGTFTLPVRITPPQGLQVVMSSSEPRVNVTITAVPTPSPVRTPTVVPTPSVTATP
jgi:YbbR domain-containing protein